MNPFARSTGLASLLLLAACGQLAHLRTDLAAIDKDYRRGEAELAFEGANPAVLVMFAQDATATIEQFDILSRAGSLELWLPSRTLGAFAFLDSNGDLIYQAGEGCAVTSVDLQGTPSSEIAKFTLRLPDSNCSIQSAPPQIASGDAKKWTEAAAVNAKLAEVASLDDPRFTPEQASAGMWQPLQFVRSDAAGLFLLQPYDPKRVPVLFVHGLMGSPRDFTFLIEHLDKTRFQPWVLSYPSGLALADLSRAMHRTLNRTRYKLNFNELHIVAHSMGGLVTRGYLNECARAKDCGYLRSFTSIASPFGGHAAGQSTLKFAPVVAPVWLDMIPGSPFLQTLFTTPLPDALPHNLLFTFHHEGMGNTSSDGTIEVWSQLRTEAQQQAATLRGFDETHMGVLGSGNVSEELRQLLLKSAPPAGRQGSAAR